MALKVKVVEKVEDVKTGLISSRFEAILYARFVWVRIE